MSRRRLPNRRRSEVVSFRHEGFSYRGSLSRFDDGCLAEVFLHSEKPNTGVAAAAASLALQFGCPADALRRALLRLSNGAAAGPLGALLDLVEEERAP